MIKGVVDLAEKDAKDIMVPRTDVVFIPTDMPLDEVLDLIAESGFSRFPVYEETIDNVIGILYVKDLMREMVKHKNLDVKDIEVRDIVRKPYFIPDSKKINALFHDFRKKRVHIAVAVDEYGGVAGIICLEDILEEIVGEIQDEFDEDEVEDIIQIGPSTYLCETRVSIEDLNEELKIALPHEDYETLGGFVFDLFDKIPVKFEKKEYEGMTFIIQDVEGNKIKSVKIELNKC
ncbi:MAG: HlyC/CorC family transporter [Spirochaetia bacterium]|nr:HlyC/CorC family transporter [Spirochaetia bacterium]MBR4436773.1 HlyC/CorC family transporter [Spirochaetales bacterium]MBR4796233.1 HlyC/CorC family transporter [Spirochaetia bacterium]MBR5016471.1 HlyC/CorC family transporter [Spirochaetia bacterium]MBR5915431.1 HlyC/CorC family transporter [Spirochaetia bacterium]